MTPEGKVKASVKAILKSYGVWYFMPVAGRNVAGIPDFVCCAWGIFLAIECKSNDGNLTDMQKATLLKIDQAGGSTLVIHPGNLDALHKALKMLMQ